jgi:hypothetical protein
MSSRYLPSPERAEEKKQNVRAVLCVYESEKSIVREEWGSKFSSPVHVTGPRNQEGQ